MPEPNTVSDDIASADKPDTNGYGYSATRVTNANGYGYTATGFAYADVNSATNSHTKAAAYAVPPAVVRVVKKLKN